MQKPKRAIMCPNAISVDEYHGYECSVTGDSCIYLFPFLSNPCAMCDNDTEQANS